MLRDAQRPSDGVVRVQGLDILRALAVFLVLGHHAAYRFAPLRDDWVANVLKYAGWIGVDIFFVISGYMITSILLRDIHRDDIRGFFVRRFFRIVPLLSVAVGTYVAAVLLTGVDKEKLPLVWSPALLLNGWTIPFLGVEDIPYTITWSLSVEETAYAVLGLAALWSKRGLRSALTLFLVSSVIFRLLVVTTGAMDFYSLYFFVPARLDGIALGGLGALGLYARVIGKPGVKIAAGAAAFLLIWLFHFLSPRHALMPTIGYAAFAVACGLWVTSIANELPSSTGPALRWTTGVSRLVASFGRLSYFVYLFHLFVLDGLVLAQQYVPGLRLSYWTAVVAACVITYVLAAVSWRYFEYPLILRGRYRDRPASGNFREGAPIR